jgi:hypothetical protein
MQQMCALALEHMNNDKPVVESRRDLSNASKSARLRPPASALPAASS